MALKGWAEGCVVRVTSGARVRLAAGAGGLLLIVVVVVYSLSARWPLEAHKRRAAVVLNVMVMVRRWGPFDSSAAATARCDGTCGAVDAVQHKAARARAGAAATGAEAHGTARGRGAGNSL